MPKMTGSTTLVIWTVIVCSLQEMDAALVHSRKVAKWIHGNNEVLSAEESNAHRAAAVNHHVTPGHGHDYDEVTWPEVQCNALFGSFQCASGQCILLAFRCDHNVDCDDGSDEEGCGSGNQEHHHSTSGNDAFDISAEGHLPNWIDPHKDHALPAWTKSPQQDSDDTVDVGDDTSRPHPTSSSPNWFETQCLDSELFFRCSTGRCIFADFRCDGEADCEDASDEQDCATETTVAHHEADDTTTSSLSSSYRLSEVRQETVGRLEVYHDGQWGTVCDDHFNDTDAKVACVSLGYQCGSVATNVEHKTLALNQPIWLDDVNCDGTESSLNECRHANWGINDCGHIEDVYIRCSKCTEGTIYTDTTTVPTTAQTQTVPGLEDSDLSEDYSESGSGSGSGDGSGNNES